MRKGNRSSKLARGNGLTSALVSMVFFGMIFFAMEVKTETRGLTSPGNLEGEFGARSVLAEEGIDGLQQNRFPACRHLRELRVQSERAVKIKSIAIEAVLPRHIRVRTGNQEMKMGKRENALAQRKTSLQVRSHDWVGSPPHGPLAAAAYAQRIDPV